MPNGQSDPFVKLQCRLTRSSDRLTLLTTFVRERYVSTVIYVKLPWGPLIFRRETDPILCIIALDYGFTDCTLCEVEKFFTGSYVYKMLNLTMNIQQAIAFWRYATNFIRQRWRLQYRVYIPSTVVYCCHIVFSSDLLQNLTWYKQRQARKRQSVLQKNAIWGGGW